MANVFNAKNWVLDTAHTTAFLKGVDGLVEVKRLEWQPAACGNTLVIKDRHGATRVSKTAIEASPAGDVVWEFGKHLFELEGFVLHTMTGGTLYVDLP